MSEPAGVEKGMAPIEIFADVSCPFTHVALRRLVDRRRSLGRDEPRLHVRAWPLELVNGSPTECELVAEEIDVLRHQVAPDLFRGFDPSAFPDTSLPALALAAAAYRCDLATGEAVSLDLRWALFEEGRNIADEAVLASIARRYDVTGPDARDLQAPVDDWNAGRARGVVGSPHFIVGGASLFCPTLDISRDDDDELHVAVDHAAAERFYDHALGT
jgi:predicted DsbA family dithiol-disulfide isomerase